MLPIVLILLGGAAAILLLDQTAGDDKTGPQSSPDAPPDDPAGGQNDAPVDSTPPEGMPTPPESQTRFLLALADSPYNGIIADAENGNGLPRHLLARLLWQESRFNPEAHNQASGAQGIAQILPATGAQPGFGVQPIANAYDPQQAIPFAGAYLAAMIKEAGGTEAGLAAYNWGLGNVRSGADWPAETVAYVDAITTDVDA